MRLLIASTNKGKLAEIMDLLQDIPLQALLPADIGLNIDVEEDGETYAENAEKKARAYCQASGLVTLADDSGLEVDALGGKPGLHSARFSGKPGATDADRRKYLLEKLAVHPQPWPAVFRSTVVIAVPEGKIHILNGECRGEIIPQERGTNGFGYDPIFLVQGLNRTMAELSMTEKNRLSHRARAILAARPVLLDLAVNRES
ncbi:RdgB/HAM1 family non-canonical purine NTP pyrophosphatase [Leptolinea tardivitalis]|uniref:dITP/XTP pyrophosphatase n=1 Tax=Leptolinea tardivitalis TaxID=229920 RepID=A0A0P6X6T5_9CHLR|nr:RdgB/HAM1 family non-canonical purine NTP pyrophosphatase [Leptolinea tardivitalis]KPL70653.1 nucleoside-triphosphate diphosphatase [Leptolinea tardivitalis]GAP22281.1 non-canonical purine NTP pyrophosphatase, RdgB/HAM1 family [Leptolinea tardivitalis]